MSYDVASSINTLLFEKDSVIIPGFGGFALSRESSSIDYIKSKISPPSKVASFNPNLTVNDGVLVDYIKNKNRCTLEQATQIVADFVKEVEAKIGKKEIVEFPKVGRLYKDYTKKLQFLPYDTNYNLEVFGLPIVDAHPFVRNKNTTTSAANTATENNSTTNTNNTTANTVAATAETPPPPKDAAGKTPKDAAPKTPTKILNEKERVANIPVGAGSGSGSGAGMFSKISEIVLPILLLASVLIVGLTYFLLLGGKDKTEASKKARSSMTVSDDKKINTSPSIDDAEMTSIPEDDDESDIAYDDATTEEDNSATDAYEEDSYEETSSSSTVEKTISSGSRECIVIVGQFSVKDNADRFIQKVERDGYEPYIGWNSEKSWNTVGVKFNYDTDSQKNRMHRQLKNEYDNAAWIYRE